MRLTSRSLVAVAVAALVAAGASAQTHSIASRSFVVSGNGTLTIDSDLGSIEVRSGAADRVQVEITCDTDRYSQREVEHFLADLSTDLSQSGNDVTVRLHSSHRGFFGLFGSHPRVHFDVTVPRAFAADLHTGGGSITVDSVDGEVRAKTSGGSLRLGDLGGSVWGRTSGGSISLDRCKGPADVHTSGGSITIGQVEGKVDADTSGGSIRIEKAGGDVSAHTSGGGIHVNEVMGTIDASTSGGSVEATLSKQPTGDCRLATSGGSVTVRLAANVAVDIDARGNRVRCDLPVTVSGTMQRGRLEGTLNGGGPTLTLRTSGGSVRIEKL